MTGFNVPVLFYTTLNTVIGFFLPNAFTHTGKDYNVSQNNARFLYINLT